MVFTMKKEEKTNVMRVLDAKKISYESHNYVDSGAISGTEVAKALGQNPDAVFKTLVTVSKSKKYYVFLVPVEKELDLKKAAACAGEKKIEMLKAKEPAWTYRIHPRRMFADWHEKNFPYVYR